MNALKAALMSTFVYGDKLAVAIRYNVLNIHLLSYTRELHAKKIFKIKYYLKFLKKNQP